MYLPTMSHLRFIEFDALYFPGSQSDVLSYMLQALSVAIVSPNALERFTLRLSIALGVINIEVLTGYSGWTVLDSTLTRTAPGMRFSSLRNVDIIIHADPPSRQDFDNTSRARVAACLPSLHEKGILSVDFVGIDHFWKQRFFNDN